MNVTQLDISRRTIAVAAALIGTVSLVIGAHAALNMRALDAAKAVSTDQVTGSIGQASRLAHRHRQWTLPRRQRAADAVDQRRPRAVLVAAQERF
ncbi:hypothetical protein ACVWZV_001983 [Bradyrhizobium sp. GM5.1]